MPKTKSKKPCDDCGIVYNTKGMKKKNGKIYCYKCSPKQSKCLMPQLSVKIPKHLKPKKSKPRKKRLKKRDFISATKTNLPPKMKGEKKPKVVSKKLHLFITRDEKSVLYKKFISQGMSGQDASKRVKFVSEKMSELGKKIREDAKTKKITEEQMNLQFLEGLSKYSEDVE